MLYFPLIACVITTQVLKFWVKKWNPSTMRPCVPPCNLECLQVQIARFTACKAQSSLEKKLRLVSERGWRSWIETMERPFRKDWQWEQHPLDVCFFLSKICHFLWKSHSPQLQATNVIKATMRFYSARMHLKWIICSQQHGHVALKSIRPPSHLHYDPMQL